ncbi:MAG: ABC transporter ATP-binding protein [Clostridia bacterium]|nr:ABC transporter ATP-binding protein [Clostridia bacterium]
MGKYLSSKEVRSKETRKFKSKYLKGKTSFQIIKKVFKYAKPYRHFMILTFVFDLLSAVAELLVPIFMGKAIGSAIGPGNVDFKAITIYSLIMLGCVLLASLFNALGTLCINSYNYKATYRIRDLLFKKINSLPLSYIDTTSHGDLLSRMINDIDVMTDGFLESFAALISGIMTIIGTLVSMLILNIPLALIIIILTPLSVLVSLYIVNKSKKYFKMEVQTQGDLSGYLEEYIAGERVVKAFNHEPESIEKFSKINDAYYKTGEKSQFFSNLSMPTTRFINGIVYGVVGLFGALQALRGNIDVSIISTFLSYANSFGRPFNEISSNISDIQSAFAAAGRVFNILEEPDEISDENLPELLHCNGEVSLKNVEFSYVPKVKLIQNLNLEVKQGMKVAIVGPTGCGKSTIINLLMRFYDVNNGSISVSGNNIKEITRSSLRNKYGMVLQETWLFNATIRENIAYGNPNISLDEVIEAAKLTGIHEFIEKMPQKYNTMVIEGGSNLSQGEKQLMCIARIMLLKPPMLILDEATSNIDTRTEMNIQKAFNTIMEGRTSFIVAHRLSTITNADVILVMNKGNIIEQGTHEELISKKGFYANLYNSQFVKV